MYVYIYMCVYSQIYPLEEDKEMLVLHRIHCLKWKLFFPFPWCNYDVFFINYRDRNSETRAVSLIQFCAYLMDPQLNHIPFHLK